MHTADPDSLPAIKASKTSCISSGCHDLVHDVAKLKGGLGGALFAVGILLYLYSLVSAKSESPEQ